MKGPLCWSTPHSGLVCCVDDCKNLMIELATPSRGLLEHKSSASFMKGALVTCATSFGSLSILYQRITVSRSDNHSHTCMCIIQTPASWQLRKFYFAELASWKPGTSCMEEHVTTRVHSARLETSLNMTSLIHLKVCSAQKIFYPLTVPELVLLILQIWLKTILWAINIESLDALSRAASSPAPL